MHPGIGSYAEFCGVCHNDSGWGGGEQVDAVAADSTPESGYSIDISDLVADDVELFTSSNVEILYDYVTITDVNTETNLNSADFRFNITSFQEGSNTIHVLLNDGSTIGSITVLVKSVEPISIEAELKDDMYIYSSYNVYQELAREAVMVTVHYNDGTFTVLDSDDFIIEGDWSYHEDENQMNQFTVTCVVDGVELSTPFETKVLEQLYQRIEVDFNQTINVPSSESSGAILKTDTSYGTLVVTGYFSATDQIGRELDVEEYDIIGNFWTGMEKFEGDVKDVILTVQDITGTLKEELKVTVNYVEPDQFSYGYDSNIYYPGDTFVKDSTLATLVYLNPLEFRDVTDQEYTVKYQNGGNSIQYEDTYVTLVYTENGKDLECKVPITVRQATAIEPSFSNSSPVYNGKPQTTQISGFVDAYMNITVTRDGKVVSFDFTDADSDGIYDLSITNAGTYKIEITLEDGYKWRFSDEVAFEWTIDKADIDVSLVLADDRWYYDEPGPTLSIDNIIGNDGKANPYFVYYGSAYDDSKSRPSTDPYTTIPTWAGTWYVVANIPETENYNGATTDPVPFIILRALVDAPVADSKIYTGTEQFASFEDVVGLEVDFTHTSIGQTNVGVDYTAIITMNDDDAYNHEWNGGSWTNGKNIVTVYWSINPAKVLLPSVINTGPWTYDENPKGIPVDHTVYFGNIGALYHITGVSDGGSYSNLSITRSQVGSYTVSFALNDIKNYVWDDIAGGNETRTCEWSISIATNTVNAPTISSKIEYGTVFTPTATSTFGNPHFLYSDSSTGVFTDTVPTDVGTYWVKAVVDTTNNWNYGESAAVSFEIVQAENTIYIDLGDEENPFDKTYDSTTIDEPKVVVTDGKVHFEYSDAEDGTYTEGLPSNAGKWYIRAVVTDSHNYKDATSEPVEVFIDWIVIPFPGITGELRFNGTEDNPYGTPQTPTVTLNFTGYPSGQGQGDAITVTVTAKTDANTASNPYYTLTVTPGKNYRWETPEKDSYRYDYELKWKILPQQVSIEVVGEREAERRDSTWHPEIATDYRFTTIFEDTLAIGLHHGTATLINHNYEWVVSTETDTDGNPYDYVDSGDFLVMYIGYKITETRYNITFTQNDWNYGDEPGYFTAEPDNNDQRIKDMLASDDGYRIVYQRMLEDGTYSQNIYNVPTEAGKYHAAIIVDAIEGFYASIQSNWDEFEIIAATIARINPNPSGDTFYNGDAYDILNIIDEQATTVNSQEDVWWFSLEQNASKEDFSKELLLTNAGTYTVWYYVSAPNHNDSEIASFHIKISPKPVTIEIGQSQVNEDGSIVQNAMYYNGEIPSISDLDIMYSLAEGSSLGTGDTLEDLGFELNLDDIKKDVDTYTVTGFDNDSEDNYVVTVNSGTFEILKIDLVVNAEGFTKTYDNIECGFSSNISGLVFTTQHDDTVTWSFRVGDSGEYDDTGVTDAGTYTVYLHGESHNYNIIATEYVTVEIEQKTLTATVQDSEVEYGRGVGEFGISYQGFANGHSEENLSLNPSFIHIYEPGYNAYDTNLNVGATITGNETFSKNYQCNVVEGELDVIPRKVTAIIGNESITYGDPSATLESTCGDMYGNDSINSYVILSIDGYDDSMPENFGTYRIIGQDRDNNDNYEVSFVGEGTQNTFGTYTITALSVTIHLVTPESLTYSGVPIEYGYYFTHDGMTYQISDDLVDDKYYKNIDGVKTELNGAPTDVGSYIYEVTVNSENFNTSQSSSSTTFTVRPALYNEFYGQTITAVDPKTTYDGKPHHPIVTAIGGDGTIHDLMFEYSGYAKNVTEEPMQVTITITSTNPNIYAPGVYSHTTTMSGSVTIIPQQVDVDWPNNVYVYDGTIQYVSPTCVIDGKTVTLTANLSPGLEFKNYRDGGYYFTATFPDTFTGARNYELTNDEKNYDMNKRPVSITLHGYNKVYGDEVDLSKISWTYDEDSIKLVGADGVEIDGGSPEAGFKYRTNASVNSPVSTENNTYYVNIDNKDEYSLNYELTITQGTLNVVHRVIEITVEKQYATYTGNEPYVGSEVDEHYTIADEILEGDLSTTITLNKEKGVDVGFYDITTTPSNLNYTIEVTNGTRMFEITGAFINANVVFDGFRFDNTEHSTSDEGFHKYASSAIAGAVFDWTFSFEENGTYVDELTFKDVGSYTVYYKVSADNHEIFGSSITFLVTEGINAFGTIDELDDWTFDDGQQSAIVVPEPTTTFNSEVVTTIYKAVIGSDGVVDVEGTISNNSTIPAFYSDTDAGTYLVVFHSTGQKSSHGSEYYNYRDIQASYIVTIGQKAVNSVTWGYTQHEFTDNPIANTITIDIGYMAFGTTTSDVETTLSGDGATMTMYASAVGDYSVVVRLTDDNYRWVDPDDDDSRCYTAVWKIYYAEDENKWTSELVLNDWTYDGEYDIPTVTAKYGTPYFLYSEVRDDPNSYSREPFTDVGTYYVIAVVDAGVNYPGIRTEEPVEYTIDPAPVPIPTVDASGIVPYNGETQTVTVSEYDEKVYVVGLSGQDAGDYKVVIGLFDTHNYVWKADDGYKSDSEPIEIPWCIEKAVVATPQYGEDGGHIGYVPDVEQTYTFVMDDNVSVYGNQGSVVDEYTATFSLVDPDNYRWNGSIADGIVNNRYSLVWYIDPIVVNAPTITSNSPWSPNGVSNPVIGMNPLYMGIDLGDYNGMILAHVDGSNVSLVSYTSHDYNVKFYLKSDNYEWSESAHAENGIVTLPWSITPITLDLELGDTSIDYTGSEITYRPIDFDSDIMAISDNRKTGAGNYTAIITLNDSVNYRWDDSLSEYRDGYTLRIPWSIEQGTFDIEGLEVDRQFDYDGKLHAPVFVNKPDWLIITVSEGDGVKDVGTSEVTVKFSVREGSNYTINKHEKTYEVIVTARPVTIVVDSATMTYGQDEPAIYWNYQVDSLTFVASDNVTVTTGTNYPENGNCGEYETTATHNAGTNYNVTVISGKLTVNPIVVEEPSGTDVSYTGEEVSHPFNEIGYVIIGGDSVGTLPGNYTAVLRLEANHVWWDGTDADKTVLWRIVGEGTLIEDHFVVDETPETYTGEEIFKTVACVNDDLVLGTDYEVRFTDNVNVGSATITVSGLGEYLESPSLVYHFTIEKANTVVDFVNDGFERKEGSDSFKFLPYVSGLEHGELVWATSDDSIATVDPKTGDITVLSVGEVTITASFSGDNNRNGDEDTIVLNVGEGETVVYEDRIVYIRVPVEVPGGDDDDPTDDKPDEPAIVYKNDNTLYIILLLVLAAVCVCFAAYIMYTHRKQEDQGGGQR